MREMTTVLTCPPGASGLEGKCQGGDENLTPPATFRSPSPTPLGDPGGGGAGGLVRKSAMPLGCCGGAQKCVCGLILWVGDRSSEQSMPEPGVV